MKEKTLCDHCLDFKTFTIHNKELTGTLKNVKYKYAGKVAVCDCCGNEIYVGSVNDHNLTKLYDEYRRVNDIISLDDVRNISKKYNIGKRPLSNLLGWGELTYTRYCDGNIPTKQYSDELKRINKDPIYYLKLLEENKDKLESELAYKKSKKKTIELINGNESNTKIDKVIKYLISRCGEITPLGLQKALYYAQGLYYAFFKEYLFEDECEAWVHGPVYKDVYHRFKDYQYNPIQQYGNITESEFSADELDVIDAVVKYVCCYRATVLEEFTHNEMPWIMARADVKDNEATNIIIDKSIIGDYFSTVKENYEMQSPKDIKGYIDDLFNKLYC